MVSRRDQRVERSWIHCHDSFRDLTAPLMSPCRGTDLFVLPQSVSARIYMALKPQRQDQQACAVQARRGMLGLLVACR